MFADNPRQWTDPRTWPPIIYIWLLFIVAGQVKPLWLWLQRKRAEGWPTASGRVDAINVQPKKQFMDFLKLQERPPAYIAELTYAYTIGAEAYTGRLAREFPTVEEATEFVRDLRGRSVIVTFNPRKPSNSVLLQDALTTLHNTRPPAPAGAILRGPDIPVWVKPLVWPLVLLAATGFSLSTWIHLAAVAGRKVAPEPMFWMLHVGIFVVWFPAVVIANRRLGRAKHKDYWKALFRGSPPWLEYGVKLFVGYAFLAALFFMSNTREGQHSDGTSLAMWRSFSSVWMAFYFAACAILYSAVHSPSESRIEPPR